METVGIIVWSLLMVYLFVSNELEWFKSQRYSRLNNLKKGDGANSNIQLNLKW